MKDAIESLPEQSVDQDSFANRKLIRPTLNRGDHNNHNGHAHSHNHMPSERRERDNGRDRDKDRDRDRDRSAAPTKKTPPAEQTNAENFYYQKQMQSKTPMVIVLRDGEQIHGVIEWYDKCVVKLRVGRTRVLVYKAAVKYLYKASDAQTKRPVMK